ncbi:hypothetical protein GCM10009533_55550 [Saccharopolyspora spinosporotrichia]|uniref:Transposase n=1 Tax=Saccharopolyspora erythraea TaxID=1836 RepID=A0ABP3NUN6_SACER
MLAREFEPSAQTIRDRVRHDGAEQGGREGLTSTARDEWARQCRENKHLGDASRSRAAQVRGGHNCW